MLLAIDKKRDNNFLYQQIYEGIKNKILEGRLKAGEKLPSKRTLAEQLDLSVNSVSYAYGQLLAEGYIYSKERKGYFVENITKFNSRGSNENKFPAELKEELLNKSGWLSLSHMTADISNFPFKEWMKCQQKVVQNHKAELADIEHPQGPYILRETICRMISLSRGAVCEPEQIVISSGTQLLIQQLMALQNKGAVFAMENPGYARIRNLVSSMQFEVRPVSLDQHGIDMKEIHSSKADIVYVTPSHQFPTGKIMPISRRIDLLNWASQSQNRYIIEDDYDSEFKYETDHIPSLQSLDRNQRVIYMGTFSKTMLPGLRISYMLLPPALLKEYRRRYSDAMQNGNSIMLFALHYFIESGEYARHVKRMNHRYESKRKLLIKELHKRINDRIHIENVPAGLHFLASVKTSKSYNEIEESSLQNKLELYTMRRFMLKPDWNKPKQIDLVIGFANIIEEKIPEAADRFARIFV
ncbi:PLP-dependent aminotransferase family protein [Peribacillus kribbensis]|uniref:MocR-like transcriptional regulator GabR n=1 Tax=Peribacillus kribbensis TaxID=356658 RepID=UPI000403C9B2|nr:PLP-dependent aminotransferase family protein [Peribacillus kribbensis]